VGIAGFKEEVRGGFATVAWSGVRGYDALRMMVAVIEVGEFDICCMQFFQQLCVDSPEFFETALAFGVVGLIRDEEEGKTCLTEKLQGLERAGGELKIFSSERGSVLTDRGISLGRG